MNKLIKNISSSHHTCWMRSSWLFRFDIRSVGQECKYIVRRNSRVKMKTQVMFLCCPLKTSKKEGKIRRQGENYLRESVVIPALGVLKARLVEQLGLVKGAWQGVGTRYYLGIFPTKTIPWFKLCICIKNGTVAVKQRGSINYYKPVTEHICTNHW